MSQLIDILLFLGLVVAFWAIVMRFLNTSL